MNISKSIRDRRAVERAEWRENLVKDALAAMCLFGAFWLLLILAPLVAL